ncbi:MAG: Fe2+-dependent dioxygenase [Pseudomonadota bacterium]
MILTIAAIEDNVQIDRLRAGVAELSWRDGRATAGTVAKQVKRNEQAVLSDDTGKRLCNQLSKIISGNPVVKAAARPKRFSNLMISKTTDGGRYGPHVDNALMGTGEARLRTDLAFTLFLTPPKDYDGGELVIHAAGMTQRVKGEAGELVLYPASSIHEVRPVSGGERIVCVGWIESLIADATQRELLFDLENLRATLRQSLPPQSAELLTLDKSVANLLRMWGQT